MCEAKEPEDLAIDAHFGLVGLQYIGMASDGDGGLFTYVYEIDPSTQEFVLRSIYVDVEGESD